MTFEFDAPAADEMVSGGLYLDEPGTYHVVVTEVEEQPEKQDGTVMDGFRVKFSVLAGTVEGQEDKLLSLLLFNPDMSHKDGGAFAKRRQAKFLYATGLLDESALGKRVKIDLQDAIGRHCVIQVEKEDDDSKFLQLKYDNIWHVDHPDAAKFPRNDAALGLLPDDQRRDPSSFPTRKAAGKNGAKKKPDVNLDDL